MVEGKEEEKRKPARCLGKRRKTKLLKAKTANVLDKATKRLQKAEIVTVKENLADKLFVRRNIITKGAIIEVKAGGENRFAIVTSRPGQEGSIEAMLLSEEEAKAALAKKEKAKAKKPAAAAEKKAKEAAEKPAENA
jgi:small subunit ribosomal protein S8e